MFPSGDFIVEPGRMVRIPAGPVEYTLSCQELADYINDYSVYNDLLTVERVKGHSLADHGSRVSRHGEPSMQRFIGTFEGVMDKIIDGGGRMYKSNPAQALLSFMHAITKYDGSDLISGVETVKRAPEVLMTKLADCAGMTVLYASMLEQTDVDYRLVYFFDENGENGHVTVAVNHMHIPNSSNGLDIDIDNNSYAIAEVTAKRFIIGISEVEKPYAERVYIQNPKDAPNRFMRKLMRRGQKSTIRDLKTGIYLPIV